MKQISKALLLLFFGIRICIAQTTPPSILPAGWERIYIKDLGSFDLPPSMEIQKGNYKEYVDEVKKIKGIDATQLTAQQKGLNQLSKEGTEKYARVMLQTVFGSVGQFLKLNFSIEQYTQADINELNATYKQEVIQQGNMGMGFKLLEWYPLKLEKINGMSCLHISYKRQFQANPPVLVHIYYFHNNDRMHALTLSYRLSEKEYWKLDFEKILKSFRITNIR